MILFFMRELLLVKIGRPQDTTKNVTSIPKSDMSKLVMADK